MTPLLAALKKSPQLPLYAQAVSEILERERRAREAFYAQHDGCKGEFINGRTVLQDAGDRLGHLVVRGHLATLLTLLAQRRRLGLVLVEKALCVFPRNDYMPDIAFFRSERARAFAAEQGKFPPPELIVEVLSPTTRRRDRGVKFEDYAANGVQEYWLVDPERETLELHVAEGGAYPAVEPRREGRVRSEVLGGWEFDLRAIFDEERQAAEARAILLAD
ncbi:MAG: Uma2 family endonuclease [Verrucomicrobia bacterium]|nr:Uma2 family endonuclease [Verrucomicrobiota bacterium]